MGLFFEGKDGSEDYDYKEGNWILFLKFYDPKYSDIHLVEI